MEVFGKQQIDMQQAANKPRHSTTTSRPVSMISGNFNANPVIYARPRW